jgi:AraC family transcriptional regulator
VDARLEGADCRIELLAISWPRPLDVTVVEHDPVLEFAFNTTPAKISEGRFRRDGASSRFSRLGSTMFKPRGVPLHAISNWVTPYSLRCVFSSERFSELQLSGDDWDPRELNACLDIDDASINASMLRLADEARSPGFATEIFVEACTTSLMVELIRYLRGHRDTVPRTTGGLSPRQLRQIQERIAAAECATPSIIELAALIGVSGRHLTRAFKQSTGQTVGAYVETVQLTRAKAWLTESDLPIKQIAARLGFAHAKNFSSAFFRATTRSPAAYRREHRKQN